MAEQSKGSKVQGFEDLHVYQQARQLANEVYTVTRQGAFGKDYGLMDQVRRAAVSVMSNIAEGFERGSNAEFAHYLYIAKGSCGEARSQLMIPFDQKYVDEATYQSLRDRCRRVSGMLSNLIAHLKASPHQRAKRSEAIP